MLYLTVTHNGMEFNSITARICRWGAMLVRSSKRQKSPTSIKRPSSLSSFFAWLKIVLKIIWSHCDLDLWPSDLKCNEFVFVQNCTEATVNLTKFSQAVCKTWFLKCLYDHIWSHCDLDLWPWISKSNQFISVPTCTYVANLVKFSKAVGKISCSETFICNHKREHGQDEDMKLLAVNHRWRHEVVWSQSFSNGVTLKLVDDDSRAGKEIILGALCYIVKRHNSTHWISPYSTVFVQVICSVSLSPWALL